MKTRVVMQTIHLKRVMEGQVSPGKSIFEEDGQTRGQLQGSRYCVPALAPGHLRGFGGVHSQRGEEDGECIS